MLILVYFQIEVIIIRDLWYRVPLIKIVLIVINVDWALLLMRYDPENPRLHELRVRPVLRATWVKGFLNTSWVAIDIGHFLCSSVWRDLVRVIPRWLSGSDSALPNPLLAWRRTTHKTSFRFSHYCAPNQLEGGPPTSSRLNYLHKFVNTLVVWSRHDIIQSLQSFSFQELDN